MAASFPPVLQSRASFESGGVLIEVDCFAAAGEGKARPAIVSLHGSGGDHAGMAQPACLLAEHGFRVYVLHYFDRTGNASVKDRGEILRKFPWWMKTLWDSVSFVSRQPNVDRERIGFVGFSLGAYLALAEAAVDSRIKAVVELYGGLPREIRPFVRRLCPVLILHGELDPIVPVREAYDLQRVLEKKNIAFEMKIYQGQGHGFRGEVWSDAKLRALAFLQKHLIR